MFLASCCHSWVNLNQYFLSRSGHCNTDSTSLVTSTLLPLSMLALKHKNVDIISLSMCFQCFFLLLILFVTCFSTHVSVIYFPACLQLSAWVYLEKLFIALHATQKILCDSVHIFLSLRQQWLNNHCNIHIYPMKLC